jgi:GxxExxY protein
MSRMKNADLTENIGAAMKVHNLLGPGFLEILYQRAMVHELTLRGLHTQTEVEIRVTYKTVLIGKHRLDIVVDDAIILELKAATEITESHLGHALSYLKATPLELALVLNFGSPRLTWKRLIDSHPRDP